MKANESRTRQIVHELGTIHASLRSAFTYLTAKEPCDTRSESYRQLGSQALVRLQKLCEAINRAESEDKTPPTIRETRTVSLIPANDV